MQAGRLEWEMKKMLKPPRFPIYLIGLYGLSWNDEGHVEYQGQVIGVSSEETFLVELYEWITGSPNGIKLIPLKELIESWTFYRTEKEWVSVGEEASRRAAKDEERKLRIEISGSRSGKQDGLQNHPGEVQFLGEPPDRELGTSTGLR